MTLEEGDALCERAALRVPTTRGSVQVAGEGIAGHQTALVQDAQVSPRGRVALVKLHGADVRLQRVHRLILLLVEYPGTKI